MIIFENWLITISYEPAEDIMYAKLPSVEEYGAKELRRALDIVADQVSTHATKNLILDSSDVSVVKMEDRVYRPTVQDFIIKLTSTQLLRFARVNNSIQNLQARAVSTVAEIFQGKESTIEFRAFNDKGDAFEWLRTPMAPQPGS
ncbi:hypothetical protein ACFSC6_16660 [Rufibacter sediminis]|uniref:Uncharacterized protein n=1 Tax=Rufibacter sediminis TaxID=2762756 RepID=A0ABR6VNB3_9BACT|nr:hypothetical protein [Rufibacter sediminis]MBC3538380.1 hypothetical protein [Rufibacter sediminis]